MTAHQTKALVLSLLLHALFLSCALVFAGNAAPLKPPVRIELAIGAGRKRWRPAPNRGRAGTGKSGTGRTPAAPGGQDQTGPQENPGPAAAGRRGAHNRPRPCSRPGQRCPCRPHPRTRNPWQKCAPGRAADRSQRTGPGPWPRPGPGARSAQAGAGTAERGGRNGSPVPAGSLDGPLQALARTQPGYPPAARRQNVEGWIRVQYVVDERGSVGPVKVLEAEPEGFFEQSVLRTVRAWRFRPGTVNGEMVQALVEQTISFRLR